MPLLTNSQWCRQLDGMNSICLNNKKSNAREISTLKKKIICFILYFWTSFTLKIKWIICFIYIFSGQVLP